jgi:hypothetical protein
MPDLVTIIVILVALAIIVSALIWNLDRFRNDGTDPLTNPDWTLLATVLTRRSRRRRSERRAGHTSESEDPGPETKSDPN